LLHARKSCFTICSFHSDPKAPPKFTHYEDNRGFNDFVNQSAAENKAGVTPYDQAYYAADRVSDQDHQLIHGLQEFEQSVLMFHDKKFD
jgi:hypothetical protein